MTSIIDHDEFDRFVKAETTFGLPFMEMLKSGAIFRCVNMEGFNKFIKFDCIKEQIGLYMLWEETDHQLPGKHQMKCVYVGKGTVESRLYSHIAKKLAKDESWHATFFECKNRIAKYLEQLLLDLYKPELNKDEVYGTVPLLAEWCDEWYDIGKQAG